MKKFLSTLRKIAVLFPVVAMLFTIGYGLSNMDFGDTPGEVAYGWGFLLFCMIPLMVGYVLSFIGNVYNAIWLLWREKTMLQWVMNGLFIVTACLLYGMLLLDFLLLAMLLLGLQDNVGRYTFVGLTILLPLFYWFSVDNRLTVWAEKTKVRLYGVLFGVLAAFVMVLVLPSTLHQQKQSTKTQDIVAQVQSFYQKKGLDYQVELTSLSDYTAYLRVTDQDMSVDTQASIDSETAELSQVYFTDETDGLSLILQSIAQQAESKDLLAQFQKEIESTMKRLDIAMPEKQYDLDKPGFFRIVGWDGKPDETLSLPEEIVAIAKENSRSADQDLHAFHGYAHIPMSTYMEHGVVLLDIGYRLHWKDADKLMAELDYSHLPDGFYSAGVTVYEVRNARMVSTYGSVSMERIE